MPDLQRLSPTDVQARLASGSAVLIDIREADEFARSHVAGAISQPLSRWEKEPISLDQHKDVIFTCRSGMRTAGACDKLAARVTGAAYILDGGLDHWMKAGLPVITNKDVPIDLMRQVQIAAGGLVLVGVALGFILSPRFFLLSGFVGAGLTFAGVTGFCGMARLLAHAPWNRGLRSA